MDAWISGVSLNPSTNSIVSLIKKCYPHCPVQVGLICGFDGEFHVHYQELRVSKRTKINVHEDYQSNSYTCG